MKPLFDKPPRSEAAIKALARAFRRPRGRPESLLHDLLAERTSEEHRKVNRRDLSKKQRKSLFDAPKKPGRPRIPDEVKRKIVELVRKHHAEGCKLNLNPPRSRSAFQEAANSLRKEGINHTADSVRNIWNKKTSIPPE